MLHAMKPPMPVGMYIKLCAECPDSLSLMHTHTHTHTHTYTYTHTHTHSTCSATTSTPHPYACMYGKMGIVQIYFEYAVAFFGGGWGGVLAAGGGRDQYQLPPLKRCNRRRCGGCWRVCCVSVAESELVACRHTHTHIDTYT